MMKPPSRPGKSLRAATRARIGLGRAGDALPTADLLDFQLAHARARDEVHGVVDFAGLASPLAALHPVLHVHSAAPSRDSYLRRPDLGRRLDTESQTRLATLHAANPPWQIVFIVADGLSTAVEGHALPLLQLCLPRLAAYPVAPILLAEQARVALGDEIGGILGAELSVMLIGERPGLSVANSMGVYLTWQPRPGRTDAERNCLSNIHADGLSYEAAACKLCWLVETALARRISGVALKEEWVPTPSLPG